jgi:hypothetical protein
MAVKKTAKAAKAKTGNNSTEALAKELRSLIPRLDAEGLQFLIEQAQVHLYNMQVDELNQTMERGAAAKAKTAKAPVKKAAPEKAQKSGLRIEGTESGSSFYIVYQGRYVMFSRDEIARMVKIASAPVTELEQREHLFDWFERERRDVFAEIPIADKFDERLKKITALLKKNFRVRN